jgi:hypothetical protein
MSLLRSNIYSSFHGQEIHPPAVAHLPISFGEGWGGIILYLTRKGKAVYGVYR